MPRSILPIILLILLIESVYPKEENFNHQVNIVVVRGERNTTNKQQPFQVSPLGNAEFPENFSKLLSPFEIDRKPLTDYLPPKFDLVDIKTLNVNENDFGKKVKKTNNLHRFSYEARIIEWNHPFYSAAIKGKYRGRKIGLLEFQGTVEGTTICEVDFGDKFDSLYFAVTPIEAMPINSLAIHVGNENLTSPVPIDQSTPSYPENLPASYETNWVKITVIIRIDGTVDPLNFVILDCDDLAFVHPSLRTVFQQWRFKPGLKEGIPVNVLATVEISFLRFR